MAIPFMYLLLQFDEIVTLLLSMALRIRLFFVWLH